MQRPELEDRTVLVTGGAGFIGGRLVEALAEQDGTEVRLFDRSPRASAVGVGSDVSVFEGDVTDGTSLAAATEGVDVVFHEAAAVSVERTVEEPQRTHAVNASGTLAVLERAREEDARVVTASSAAVYGDPQTVPIAEDHPTEPRSPYGVQKLAADHYTRLYSDLYGLPTVSLRYFNVYGPGQDRSQHKGVIGHFVERAREGRPLVVYGDGSQTRDFVHVSDVVRANLLAARTDAVGEAVNVGTGTAVSVNRLASLVERIFDADAEVIRDDARPGDIDASVADVSRARERLGFEANVSLQDGLATMVG